MYKLPPFYCTGRSWALGLSGACIAIPGLSLSVRSVWRLYNTHFFLTTAERVYPGRDQFCPGYCQILADLSKSCLTCT